jgi:hypothetical protein
MLDGNVTYRAASALQRAEAAPLHPPSRNRILSDQHDPCDTHRGSYCAEQGQDHEKTVEPIHHCCFSDAITASGLSALDPCLGTQRLDSWRIRGPRLATVI